MAEGVQLLCDEANASHKSPHKAADGRIARCGRAILGHGTQASANLLRSKTTNADPWVIGLRRRRPSLVVAVALANKTARIAWAVMLRQEDYQRAVTAA